MGFLTPQAHGEKQVLKTYALQQLAQLRTTVHGLSDEQARSTPSASGLNLSGLLRHGGMVAVFWSDAAASAPRPPSPPADIGADSPLEECIDDGSTLPETLDFFDRCVAFTAERIDAVEDLGAPVPVPEAPWFPRDLEAWEARWALTHILTELARHVGHADIIRESIDGKGSYELNDLVEAEAA